MNVNVQSVELSRLFSLMDGIQADDLFAGMGGLSQSEMPVGGLNEGPSTAETASAAGERTEVEDQASGGNTGGGLTPADPDKPLSPRALYRIHQPPTIERGSCTKICPASSSSPKYKFVVPNDFVHQYMQHLVERPFQLVDGCGGSWDCILIQRKNKEKYEYMIQGWRRYGEDNQIMEGDTVQFRMAGNSAMQVSIIKRGAAARAKGLVEVQAPMEGVPSGPSPAQQQQQQLPPPAAAAANVGLLPSGPPPPAAVAQAQNGLAAAPDLLALVAQQQQQDLAAAQQQQELAALQAQQAASGMDSMQRPRSSGGFLPPAASGSAVPGGSLPGSDPNRPMMGHPNSLDMAAVIEQLSKRQRLNEAGAALAGGAVLGGRNVEPPQPQAPGPPQPLSLQGSMQQQGVAAQQQMFQQPLPVGPPNAPGGLQQRFGAAAGAAAAAAGADPAALVPGALPLLSDVADFDALLQENMALREELRLAQSKVATLESGVLNIKAVLTKNSDPGLIAITGVLNLVNHVELPEFLPELTVEGRAALSSACAEIRRHLSSVVKMCWLLRECSTC